jgi:hypothetical protein
MIQVSRILLPKGRKLLVFGGPFFGAEGTLLKGWESKDVEGSCRVGRPSLNPAVKPLGRQSLLRWTPGQVGDASCLKSWRSRGRAAATEQVPGERRSRRHGPLPSHDPNRAQAPTRSIIADMPAPPCRGSQDRRVVSGGSGAPPSPVRSLIAPPRASWAVLDCKQGLGEDQALTI